MSQANDPTPLSTADEQIGRRLKEAREFMGFTQELVAEKIGVSRSVISAMEAGKRRVNTTEVAQFARLYRRPVAYLAGLDDDAPTTDPTTRALFRATQDLTERDRTQVLRFAQFLKHAGPAPRLPDDEEGDT